MPTTERLRNKLINKLKELFQLNQPDLDFGFYRIMHAKAEQVLEFIENDLLAEIQDAFGAVDEARKTQLKQELDNAIQIAIGFGAPDPESTSKVIEARAEYEVSKNSASSEAEIYDHLYRFFERYYDEGDFISRRYYTRETPGKAAPFAIPYNGEEVKLHWANADQYYIKTTEYFSNFTVNLSDAIKGMKSNNKRDEVQEIDFGDESIPEGLKLHFRIVDATEGEHANVKASDATKRYFILHKDRPLELNQQNELIINFEYRPDPAKTKQEIRNKESVALIINALKDMGKEETLSDIVLKDYLNALSTLAATEKEKDRILLAKYLNQYTARNTMDYFIHKDLGTFLKRELDFYIKNEVMRLDDIENADVPKVEDYLTKIKVLRKIAGKLIEFMAQLEDFQKKLWLKKKFVVETNYCITLDRVPEKLYPLIVVNEAQREEWVKLFAIDGIDGDAVTPAYTVPLSTEFLKTNDKLVLDTRFFDAAFKDKLLNSIQDFDEQCDGLLIHSENFQALNLLRDRYREQVKCVYIDPPYNSKTTEIAYKNTYKHSSWLSLMQNRLVLSSSLSTQDGSHVIAIDENEQENLGRLIYDVFPEHEIICIAVIHNKKGIQGDYFSYNHEYAFFIIPSKLKETNCVLIPEDDWKYDNLRKWGRESERHTAKNCFYPILVKDNKIAGFGDVCDIDYHPSQSMIKSGDILYIYPVDSKGVERKWRYARQTVESIIDLLKVHNTRTGEIQIVKAKSENKLKTVWEDTKYIAGDYGTKWLTDLGVKFSETLYPKSIHTVMDSITAISDDTSCILDYFAGSGTTGHAVINLNREDDGNRKFVLVEMGDYYDTILKPRISKAIYSEEWKDGEPQNRDTGISHCYKYLRLESYEDTLNNLVLQGDPIRDKAIAGSGTLKEDYLLNYMLDVESRGSQSLLNIDDFHDPSSYFLKVKKPGSDEYIEKAVDLIETFNYLIGLRLVHFAEPQTFSASFKRLKDPDLPHDQETKLVLDEDLKQAIDGKWWIRKLEGWVPKNPYTPHDGLKEKVLIVWRKLTGNLEEDNLILDTWFQKNRISTLDWEFDTIYVNGSNNLPNLQQKGDNWKVRLIEEEFRQRMWDTVGQ